MKIMNSYAVDIPDAWFQLMWDIKDKSRSFLVEQGSYVGEKRLQYDFVVINIKQCYAEPWHAMLPIMPEGSAIPAPVTADYIYDYIPYLFTDAKEKKEVYTYGERIKIGLDKVISLLKATPNTNQAVISIARPEDVFTDDPPCLREISYQAFNGVLHQFLNFRSWDLWAGLPANLAGLAVLHKFVADEAGLKLGETVAVSKGLHIYGYAEKLAEMRIGGYK